MKVNFLARTIELTAEEMRRASAPNSGKYHELLKIMRDLPDFTIEVKHRRTFIKNSNLGLTYEYMEQYINQNAPEKLGEFHDSRTLFGYSKTAKWFRNTFPMDCVMVHFCTNQEPAA